MFYFNKSCTKKFIIFILFILFAVVLSCTTFIFKEAVAEENIDFDTVTVMGKVLDSQGDRIASPQVQYFDGKETHSLHYGDTSGGLMFVIPANSDCSLTFYQTGYTPKTLTFSYEYLQEHKPIMNIGNVVLDNSEYVNVSGNVSDLFYSTGVEDVLVVFYLLNINEACKAQTDEDGNFSMSVPRNYEGIWQLSKDGYNLYVSEETSYSQERSNVNFYMRPSNKFVVSFNSNGGSTIDSQIVEGGLTIEKPDNPILENFSFDGWYVDNNTFQNSYDFSQPVNDDITLYAKWNQIVKLTNGTTAQTSDNLLYAEIFLIIVALSSCLYFSLPYVFIKISKKDTELDE